MRHVSPPLPLTAPWIAHAHAADLAAVSALLDAQPALSAGVQQDLEAGCPTNPRTGRPGLSGEQTLRLLIVRQLTGWTYAELAFHLADSMTYRAFCRVSALTATPSKSALAAPLRRVSPRTLAALNDHLVTSAAARAVEPARSSPRGRCAWMRPWCRWRSIRQRIRVSCSMRCACSTGCSGAPRPRRASPRITGT